MHEAKGELKMEIQITSLQRSLNGELGIKSLAEANSSGRVAIGNGSCRRKSESASGDESSDDEPIVQVPPKKNRLKEPNSSLLLSNQCSASSILLSSPPLPIALTNGNGVRKDIGADDNDDNMDEDNDTCGVLMKHGGGGGASASFTSGENSDAETGPEGDESNNGIDMKQEDSTRKIFECDVCNMKFSNGANMRRHRMRHSGIKPYECKICKKRFFRKDHLAEHMATHSKLLPFRCPICNKGFQRQIAMRAHFQNEHVGGSQDMVKVCPLCSVKAGSMKSLRAHFYSSHGIDLDNPMPHSPLLSTANASGNNSSTLNGNGEYSELAHALGFEDREKSSDSNIIPSHFLVPQIEISSNASFLPHFPFSADSYYNFAQNDRERHNSNGGSSSPNVSPQSDRSSNVPSSTDLGGVIVKKEILDEHHLSSPEQALQINEDPSDLSVNKASDIPDDEVQDSPEDLSSGNSSSYRSGKSNLRRTKTLNDGKVKWKHFLTKRSSHSSKPSSFSIIKISPLKSLLCEDSSKDKSQNALNAGTNHLNNSIANNTSNKSNSSTNALTNGGRATTANNKDDSNSSTKNNSHSGQSSSSNIFQSQTYDGESMATPSASAPIANGTSENSTAAHSRPSRRGGASIPNPIHQCIYCGIIFPDKTLYFLHKGCHSDSTPWRCNICGEFCYNVYDFNSHLLSKSHQ